MKTDNRTRLLNMAKGHEDEVLVCRALYTMCAASVAELEAAGVDMMKHRDGSTIMPAAPNALQDVWEASHTQEDAGSGLHFVASFLLDNDEDIRQALATQPCLVKMGGTLHAMNTDRHGAAAIIMKDMRNHTHN